MSDQVKNIIKANPKLSRRMLLKAGMAGIGTAAISQLAACASNGRSKTDADATSDMPEKIAQYIPMQNKAQYRLRAEITQLNPDGTKSVPGVTLNGLFPAPEIRVKEGDMFRAQVENKLPDQETSIHWHGLLVPAGMDGVPNVSHVPLKPNEVFFYEYPLLQSGTYWYHSHFGFQEQQGLGGPFIIEAAHEPLQYDHDVVIFLSDWLHRNPYKVYDALRSGKSGTDKSGAGPDLSDIKYPAFLMNGKGNNAPWAYKAKPGERIRLRIINGAASTFFRFMLDSHPLTITHADGMAVQPVEVDNMLIGVGECYDALVTVKESGSYTLRGESQDGSGQAIGVMHTPDVKSKADLSKPQWKPRALSYGQLLSIEPTTLPDGPQRRFTIDLTGNMKKYIWSMNEQVYPNADPILFSQGDQVQIALPNKTGMWHPIHLHGHFFRLLIPGVDPRFAPLKHTFSVAPKKTIKIEFTADNPGKWFFHCHNLYHLEAGMARELIYRV